MRFRGPDVDSASPSLEVFGVVDVAAPDGGGSRSPRAGVAWDAGGDGRTAVRASYAMVYDFPTGKCT